MYYVLCIIEGRKDAQKNKVERSPHYEKTSQSPHQRQKVASGYLVRFCPENHNAERRNPPVILFQVRDLAAKACGEPHIAPSWAIAKASLGAMLAKTPDLAERAHSFQIEYLGEFDPETGYDPYSPPVCQWIYAGDVCLAEFRAACAKEEFEKQEEADNEQ